jgi:hypothetical protein
MHNPLTKNTDRRMGLFAADEHPVMSLSVQAADTRQRRVQGQFEVLVRHLLFRFLHNELVTAEDDETKRAMTIAYAVGLPGMVVALILVIAYHPFPPQLPRTFWGQAQDHYLYVMYAFVAMGAATVYEWDLLFPDFLDVFVLSVMPVEERRLFLARVLALAIFLGLVLLGTNILGIICFPIAVGPPHMGRLLIAHAVAVLASGSFAAVSLLALQGILLNVLGERVFRRITPLLQGAAILGLLTLLFLFPLIADSLQSLLTSGDRAVLWFPPFWFLGIYEQVLRGQTVLPVFRALASCGWWGLLVMSVCVGMTYPVAYRRKVRQTIEGGAAVKNASYMAGRMQWLLHRTLLRKPGERAIFHFISQTILRSQRQRVMLAMYAGLGVALMLSAVLGLRIGGGHIRVVMLANGVATAIPAIAFWTVAGLHAVLRSSVDRRGTWLFYTIIGRPRAEHFAGTRIWLTLWAGGISVAIVLILKMLVPSTRLVMMGQMVVALGVAVVVSDVFLFFVRRIPFTHQRKSAVHDLPMAVLRYLILFPLFAGLVAERLQRTRWSWELLVEVAVEFLAAHMALLMASRLGESTLETPPGEEEEFPQTLGLRG